MKHPHISTGPHMTGRHGPRFRINTAPGIMEPKHRVNEAHSSYLEHHTAVELHDELNAWLEANPTAEELHAAEVRQAKAEALREAAQILGEAADLHDHPAHQTTAEALRIAQRRLELAADRLDPTP